MIENQEKSWCFLNKYLFEAESDSMEFQYELASYEYQNVTPDINFDDNLQPPISPSFKNMNRNLKDDNYWYFTELNDARNGSLADVEPIKVSNLNPFEDVSAECKYPNTLDTFSAIDFDKLRQKIEVKDKTEFNIEDSESWIAVADEPIQHLEFDHENSDKAHLRPNKMEENFWRPQEFDINSIEVIHTHERRWGKEEDRKLFQILIDLENSNIIQIDDLTKLSLPKEWKSIMKIIWRKWGWIGPHSLFNRRVKNMLKQSQFSAREILLLKRILRLEFKHKNLNYEAIATRFPGKNIQYIHDICQKIINERVVKRQ